MNVRDEELAGMVNASQGLNGGSLLSETRPDKK